MKMPARTRQIRAGEASAGETGGETIDPALMGVLMGGIARGPKPPRVGVSGRRRQTCFRPDGF